MQRHDGAHNFYVEFDLGTRVEEEEISGWALKSVCVYMCMGFRVLPLSRERSLGSPKEKQTIKRGISGESTPETKNAA